MKFSFRHSAAFLFALVCGQTLLADGGGASGGMTISEPYPVPTAWKSTIGTRRYLYIPAVYADETQPPASLDQAYSNMTDFGRFIQESSAGKLNVMTTVAPLMILPHTLTWYNITRISKLSDPGTHVQQMAMDAALALGYDPSQYDCVITRINGHASVIGTSFSSGYRVTLISGGMDVINHECGHSLGLGHAHWWATSDSTSSGYRPPDDVKPYEYGSIFDVMGDSAGVAVGFAAHYGSGSKRNPLHWLTDDQLHLSARPGTYRIYACDQPRHVVGQRYGLTVRRNALREFQLEYRPAWGGLMTTSALVLFQGADVATNSGAVVDTMPGSYGGGQGKMDAPIALGRTFSDFESDVHLTVLAKNETSPPSLDIRYNRGPFPGNVPPQATLATTATTIAVGGSVTLTATASDANGDELAYNWSFGGEVMGTNTPVFTRTFTTAQQVTAMLTVSDMKGGTVRRSVVINVGAHGKQLVTGTVKVDGQGVGGVVVYGNGKECYSDADGTYALSGLSTGSAGLVARLPGYNLTPVFTYPLKVVPGTNTANWTALPQTFVTLTALADATEGGTPGKLRLTRSGDTTAALTVFVSPPEGTAVKDTDYTLSPNPVVNGWARAFTIPAGASSLDVVVTAASDGLAEGPETLALQVVTMTSRDYFSREGNSVVLTVNDADTALPLAGVSATTADAREGEVGGAGSMTFTRTGATAAALDLTVAWSGTAASGTDFKALPTKVTIPAGQSSVAVLVEPTDDAVIETAETVVATLSSSANYLADRAAAAATVTIWDNDTPSVSVSVPTATTTEGAGDAGVFLLTRTGSTAAPLTVYYGMSGSALHGTDYERLSGQVVIPAGATTASVAVQAYDDENGELDETVKLSLATFNQAYSVGAAYSGTVTIKDNNDRPMVSIRKTLYGAGAEGGTTPSLTVRCIGSRTGTINVRYALSGTATPGVDYTAPSGTLTVPATGTSDTSISFPLLADTLAEGTESIRVTLLPSPDYLISDDPTFEVTVMDNDCGDHVAVTHFALDNGTARENSPRVEQFFFSRLGSTGDLTVNYAISGTATNGVDYAELSGTVVIPAGQKSANVDLRPIDDLLAEGNETITLTVQPGAGYGPALPNTSTINLADNESPAITVGFAQSTLTTSEIPGPLGEYRDIPVVLSAPSAVPITVQLRSAGGSALGFDTDWGYADAADGNALVRGLTLTFEPGVTSQLARIRIRNDGVTEPTETAILELFRPWQASLAGTGKLTVSITDATAGLPPIPNAVRLTTAASTRLETAGSEPQLQVVLDQPAGATPITVDYAATGTATAGADYTFAPGTLTFAPGEQVKTIPLSLLTDALSESPESIIITLSNPVGAVLGAPASHTITLLDSTAPVVDTVFAAIVTNPAANSLVATVKATPAAGRSIASWAILSGNTGNAFALSASGQLTVAQPTALATAGGLQLKVRVTDNLGATGEGVVNVIVYTSGIAAVSEQRWAGSAAFDGENWTATAPTDSGRLATLTPGQNVADNYSRRLVAYLKPPTTGNYTFWIAGDDKFRLYLSTDGYEANKVLIGSGPAPVLFQNWDNSPQQKSASIALVAGQIYWIEVQQVESGGGDHVSVAWSGPGISRVALPASALVPAVDGLILTAPAISLPPPNTAPSVSTLPALTLAENTASAPLAFTVGDAQTAATALVVNVSSSNFALLPTSGIVVGGSGANRTVTLTPLPWQNGTATVTVAVNDGQAITRKSFVLTVTPVNAAPTITPVRDQAITQIQSYATAFMVGDRETDPSALTVSGVSSDPLLVPAANIVFGGGGANRTVVVTPVSTRNGTAVITLSVSDGTASTATTFNLVVDALPSTTVWTATATGPLPWSNGANWDSGRTPPNSRNSTVEFFTGRTLSAGATTSTNDTPGGHTMNVLTLGGSGPASGACTVSITGNALLLAGPDGTDPVINLAATAGTGFAYTLAAPVTLQDPLTVQGDGTATFTLSGPLSGAGGLTKIGASTLALTGANTYLGGTRLGGGTLVLSGGTNRLPTAGVVDFTATSTLSLAGVSQTLADLNVANGVTATVTGSGGTLLLNGGSFDLSPTALGVTLDLSKLDAFVFNNPTAAFNIRPTAVDTITATLKLAASSQITANEVKVGDDPAGSSAVGNLSELALGQTTRINAATISIGRSRAMGRVSFQLGLPNPALTIRGSNGGPLDRADLNVSMINSGGNVNTRTSLFDVSGGTLDAMLGTLNVGYNWRATGTTPNTGTVLIGAGSLDATTVYVGRDVAGTGSAVKVTGNFTASNSQLKIGSLILGTNYFNTMSATVNLNGGSVLRAQSIQIGNGSATRTFNWNDGTIKNYDAALDLTISGGFNTFALLGTGLHAFDIDSGRQATVTQVISNSGSLTKLGLGTLTLNASNTYTGTTTVSAGTLSLAGSLTSSISNAATLAPQGQAVTSKAFTQTGTGTLRFRINGTVVGSGYDQLKTPGPITLAGTLELVAVPTLAVGNSFTLIDNTGTATVSGTFAGLPPATAFFADDQWWSISYTGGTGNDVVLTRISASAWQTWQAQNFGAAWIDPLIAGDTVDYDRDGLTNLLEYALGTDPKVATAPTALPQASVEAGRLTLTYKRNTAATDLTLIVQGTDSLTGMWSDLAKSVNGAVSTVIIVGVPVSETGTGASRIVKVGDRYLANDAAHPTRFLRLKVVRP